MRSFLSLIAIALSASLSAAGARRVPTQTESEFGLGNGVGRCLVHKCLVFHGFILSALPKTGDPVAVQVEEWLHGAAADGEPMMVPYEEFPEHSSGDGGFAVATAWQRVKISPNEPVTVVLAMEAGLGVQVGEPILVTSDEREAGIIRALTDEARDLDSMPDRVTTAVSSLAGSPNPSLAGYLFQFLQFRTTLKEPDLASELGMDLLVSPSVPPGAMNSVALFVSSQYGRLSTASRSSVVDRFNALIQQFTRQQGQEAEAPAALAALLGLAHIARDYQSVQKVTAPEVLKKLAAAYIAQSRAGIIPRANNLEVELGVGSSVRP